MTSIGHGVFSYCYKLKSTTFEGDAPKFPDFDKNMFEDAASDFKIYYYDGKTGWTTPKWNGYSTVMLKSDESDDDDTSDSTPSNSNSSGGGGGGGSSSATITIPASDGSVSLSGKQSGGNVTLDISSTKITEIINSAKNETVFIDLSKASGATTAIMPTTALNQFAKAGLDVTVKLPQGIFSFDTDTVVSMTGQEGNANISISLKQLKASDLPANQKYEVSDGDLIFDITAQSDSQNLTSFGGGSITITVPYNGKIPVAVWYLNNNGQREKIDCIYDASAKTVIFTTDHLSKYLVGMDDGAVGDRAGTTITAITPTMPINLFEDVSGNDWYIDHVIYVYDKGLMSGTSTNPMLFSPNDSVTRAMAVTVLYNAAGSPDASGLSNPFQDVNANTWYTDAVKWAADNGIASGIGENMFDPDSSITREQTSTMLMNYMEYKNIILPVTQQYVFFADESQIADYAKNAMQTLNKLKIMNGKGNNVIAPKDMTVRSEYAAILHNFMNTTQK